MFDKKFRLFGVALQTSHEEEENSSSSCLWTISVLLLIWMNGSLLASVLFVQIEEGKKGEEKKFLVLSIGTDIFSFACSETLEMGRRCNRS